METVSFTFSRTLNVPLLVLQLSAGQMALLNVIFLVSDDETAFENLLSVLPVLRNLVIDSRTHLEQNWSSLYGNDCSSFADHSINGIIGRLGLILLALLQ